MNLLDDLPDVDTAVETLPFRKDVFSQFVEKGTVHELKDADGTVIDILIDYQFSFGILETAVNNRRNLKVARLLANNTGLLVYRRLGDATVEDIKNHGE